MYTISAHDIAHWASSHPAAAGLLPELVRRLIWSQGASPSNINFPAGRETQRPGYDGFVVKHERSNPFIPDGFSVWELSVDQKPVTKAQDDYTKRTYEKGATPSSAAVYVALTAQRWTGANEWAKERSAEGKWREVLAYDASTLEQWLEVAPAVAVWFARCMGRSHEQLTDALGYLRRWQEKVPRLRLPRLLLSDEEPMPPLAYLLLVGRGAEAEQVRNWAIEPYTAPLKVHAERRDEAIAFVCAALAAPLWPRRAATIPRVVVAASADALDRMLESREPDLILLSDFEEPSRPGSRRAHIMEFTDRQERDAVILRPQLAQDLARALVERLDMLSDEANQLAQEARGLHALRRALGLNDRPHWANNTDLIPALLLGRWSMAPGSRLIGDPVDARPPRYADRDHEALTWLWGRSPEAVEQEVLQPHARGAEPPLEVMRNESERLLVWRWRSRRDAWTQLHPLISPTMLDTFCQLAVEVLSDDNPLIGVGTSDWHAMLRPLPPRYSETLRHGVSEGLALLATTFDEQPRVNRVVRQTLHSAGFERWASLTDELPMLAEAAPTAFLKEVEALLERADACQFARLFEPYGSSHRGAGLLDALGLIGSAPDYELVREAVRMLCRLQEQFAPSANTQRQPWELVRDLFHPVWPESSLSFNERRKLMEKVERSVWGREVAWRARESWLARFGAALNGRMRTPHRGWGRTDDEMPSDLERVEGMRASALMLLEQAKVEPARWRVILQRHMLDIFDRLELADVLVGALHEDASAIRANESYEQIVWELRTQLHWMIPTDGSEWEERAHKLWEQLLAVYEGPLMPDLWLERRWLFGSYAWNDPKRPAFGSRSESEQHNELRNNVLRNIYDSEGFVGLQRLIDEVGKGSSSDFVAGHLGRVVNTTQLWETLETLEPPAERAELFWWVLLFQYTRRKDVSVEDLYTIIDRVDMLPEARREFVRASVVRCLPLEQRTLEYLVTPGREALRELYWRHREVWLTDDISAEIAFVALREWVEQERWPELIQFVGYRQPWLGRLREHDEAALVELMQRVLWGIDEAGEQVWADERIASVEDVHKRLVMLGGYDEARMAMFELRRFDKLDGAVTTSLFKQLGQDPAFFVEALSHAYHSGSVDDTPPSAFASNAYNVLHSHFAPTFGSFERVAWWSAEVLRLARAVGRGEIAAQKVGEVLAKLGGQGDRWPAREVCEVLARSGECAKQVREGFEVGCFNQNGSLVVATGEPNVQERDLAERYRRYAESWDDEFDVVANLLRKVAASFEWWARRDEDEAARERRREGMYQRIVVQEGLFGIRQAEEEGFASLIPEWMELGRLEEMQPGVYRITSFDVAALRGEAPIDQVRQSRMALWLWSRQEGVFSHETALSMLGLSDVNPSKVHMTLPLTRRGRVESPDASLVLHFAAVSQRERLWRDEVPITSAARSVNDCAVTLQPDLLRQAVTQGLERGLFSREDIAPALEALEKLRVKVVVVAPQRRF